MSLSGALNASLSGLTAASRRAEAVSTNVANAGTPSYGRREVILSSGLVGGLVGGVTIAAVQRQQNVLILNQRREADAGLAGADVAAQFLSTMEGAIGLPGENGSLSERLSDFETALIEAASRPDSDARLQSVVRSATGVADHLNAISDKVQDERLRVDQEISRSVEQLNIALKNVVQLNGKIAQMANTTQDYHALVDERQRVIDGISDLIPIQQIDRPNGAIALFSPGGAMLVDGKAAEIGFAGAAGMTVYMSLAGGGLSGLTINGQPVSTNPDRGPIAGGRLSALFNVRDTIAPDLQTQLDAVARDLIERFEDPAVDPTRGTGDPGLFTDNGLALDITEETGLALRISVNALVDPGQGGSVWRIRDGLGAATPGEPGNATMLNSLRDALATARVPASGDFGTARDALGLSGDLLSQVSVAAYDADTRVSFARAQSEALISYELQSGVDTDQEMQELLLVEQAYAANARVMSTIDDLLQQLLRI